MHVSRQTSRRALRATFTCAAAIGCAAGASAATLRVPGDQPTIQAAIDASQDGDEILVAPGTYNENLAVWYKQISLVGVSGADATIVDGRRRDSVLFLYFLPEQTARVSGFTFRHGAAGYGGGGIDAIGGAPVIEDNVIAHNSAEGEGGGLYLSSSSATVRHNRIVGNVSQQWAGGLSTSGGQARIEDNVFEGNRATGNGGALVAALDDSPLIQGNVIRNNSAADGGGVYVTFGSRARFFDNLVVDNAATRAGGGVYITLADGKSSGRWVNNTIADNTAPSATQLFVEGRGRNVKLSNNAIVGPATGAAVVCQAEAETDSPQFVANDVHAGGVAAAEGVCAATATGGSNLSVAPGFASGGKGLPYHLAPDSPLVDAGSNDAVAHLHRDFGGQPRIVDGGHGAIVDIGADEYVPQ